MSLIGTTVDGGQDLLLIGQHLIAVVDVDQAIKDADHDTYSWVLFGNGDPFENYTASNSTGHRTNWAGSTSNVASVYFGRPAAITPICTVHLASLNTDVVVSRSLATVAPDWDSGADADHADVLGKFELLTNVAFNPPLKDFKLFHHTEPNPLTGVQVVVGMQVHYRVRHVEPFAYASDTKSKYTQLISLGIQVWDATDTVHNDPWKTFALDGNWPDWIVPVDQANAAKTRRRFGDTPGFENLDNAVFDYDVGGTPHQLQATRLRYDGSFKLHLMYRPPGEPSVWVSLKLIPWACFGEVTKTPPWTVVSNPNGTWGTTSNYPHQPEWTFNYPAEGELTYVLGDPP